MKNEQLVNDFMTFEELLEEYKNAKNHFDFISDKLTSCIKRKQKSFEGKNTYAYKDKDLKEQQFDKYVKDKEDIERYFQAPSENPKYTAWEQKDIDDWKAIDFAGYYLSKYKLKFKYEDKVFSASALKSNNCATEKILKVINNDKQDLRSYIDWFFEELENELEFITDIGYAKTVMNPNIFSKYLNRNNISRTRKNKITNEHYHKGEKESDWENE